MILFKREQNYALLFIFCVRKSWSKLLYVFNDRCLVHVQILNIVQCRKENHEKAKNMLLYFMYKQAIKE